MCTLKLKITLPSFLAGFFGRQEGVVVMSLLFWSFECGSGFHTGQAGSDD